MSDEQAAYVVCTRDHVHASFGEIPKGSRWFADDERVLAEPTAFEAESPAVVESTPKKPKNPKAVAG